jgi:hypothetical protein
MLTGDVPSQHLMCHVHSAGRRCQGHPADGTPVQSVVKQCARAARRTVLVIRYTRSFPCTPILRRSLMSGCEKIAPATNICSSKCCIHYVYGPTCRGSAPLCMPPLAIKWEACNVTTQALSSSLKLSRALLGSSKLIQAHLGSIDTDPTETLNSQASTSIQDTVE